jgi:5-(carboxyamino)imidazole ribonucleotide synthase
VYWDSPDNVHRDGILRTSTVPSSDTFVTQVEAARTAAAAIAESLGHVGVLTVEFFASRDGPVVNEIAPRVHNSGHWTIEGAFTSQFEQHIRAICDLPPGSTELAAASARMDNLIGDEIHDWQRLLADPHAHVHIYGKGEARPGRKMGHVTRLTLR